MKAKDYLKKEHIQTEALGLLTHDEAIELMTEYAKQYHQSQVNNVVLDDVIKCDSLWHNKHVHRFGSCSVCNGEKKN